MELFIRGTHLTAIYLGSLAAITVINVERRMA